MTHNEPRWPAMHLQTVTAGQTFLNRISIRFVLLASLDDRLM